MPSLQIEDSTAGLRVEQDAAARTVSGIEGEVTALRYARVPRLPAD